MFFTIITGLQDYYLLDTLTEYPIIPPTENLPELDSLKFNDRGLIPAIAQQFDSGQVLMMAWMNRDSLEETFRTGQACYWSRSRGKLWRKGETSGHIQKIKEIRIDCDRDTILLLVEQTGVACHTGRPSCFFLRADQDVWKEAVPTHPPDVR